MKLYAILSLFSFIMMSNLAYSGVETSSFEEQAKQHKWDVDADSKLPQCFTPWRQYFYWLHFRR